jgi:regulator of sirC expression with transglutaminase-like and TPR domain
VDLPWALAAREAAEAACDGALRELVAHHVRRGRISAAFACAARRVRLDPLSEEAHREWARLYRRAGRTVAALGHLEAFERAARGGRRGSR